MLIKTGVSAGLWRCTEPSTVASETQRIYMGQDQCNWEQGLTKQKAYTKLPKPDPSVKMGK